MHITFFENHIITIALTLFFISYLIGSIPFAVVVSRLKKIDLTKVGSGNFGATNVYRAMGIYYAILVFSLDVFRA